MSSYRSTIRRALGQMHRLGAGLASTGRGPIDLVDRMSAPPWESGVPIVNGPRLARSRRGPVRGQREGAHWDGRWVLTLTMVASLLVSMLVPPVPVHADPPDPAARLQFVIRSIHVLDDRDLFGSGEMEWFGVLCPGDVVHGCTSFGSYLRAGGTFSANSGRRVPMARVVPLEGDAAVGSATIAAGMPVFASTQYMFRFNIGEVDPLEGDDMGDVIAAVDREHGWGIGTFTVRSHHDDGSNGDYELTYEIRQAPLPDLRANGVTTFRMDDGRLVVCPQIENIGELPSPPTPMTERINDTILRTYSVPALEPGQTTQDCLLRSQLPAQAHTFGFFIDEGRQLPEMNEDNNTGAVTVDTLASATGTASAADPGSPAPPPMPSPQPKPSGELADLTVKAIKVNGQAPDGKADCTAGPNAVAVVVKNAGKGDAASFSVRLSVDGDTLDQNVDALRAGGEREVAFENVPLKKGQHTLKAVADPEHALAEGKDDNNDLKVSVRCTDAA